MRPLFTLRRKRHLNFAAKWESVCPQDENSQNEMGK